MTDSLQQTYAAATSVDLGARSEEVAGLLNGAVDLHCHSGPAAMPRILDHHDAMLDAAAAKFQAVVFKDHYYPGMAHATILEKIFPNNGVRLFSGIVLNNSSGGINPHAVDHAVKIGAKIIWMPTMAAENHIRRVASEGKTFPKTAQPMLDPIPLTVLNGNGTLTDATLQVLDIIAAGDVILAGGHLHVSEMMPLFTEAKRRGVKKMLVNHPTYIVGCADDDISALVELGVHMEHSICMFVDGKSKRYGPNDITRLVGLAGVDRTIFSSDLGMQGGPRPVDGFRLMVKELLDLQFSAADIRRLISGNAARLLGLN